MNNAEIRRRLEETRRKIDLAKAFLEVNAAERQQQGDSGQVTIFLVWEQGYIKRLRTLSEGVVDDEPS